MFAFAPAPAYSYRRPSAYSAPELFIQPRHTYLAALAEERAAEARHLAALANGEALRQQRVAARERALLDATYGYDSGYPSYDPHLTRRSVLDPYLDEQLPFDDEYSSLGMLLARDELARQRQEEHRRAALRRQVEEERVQRRLSFLRQRHERESALRQYQEHFRKQEDSVEPVFNLVFGGRPRRVSQQHGCQGACKFKQGAGLQRRPSRPELFSLILRDLSNSDVTLNEQQVQPSAQSTSQSAPTAPAEPACKATPNPSPQPQEKPKAARQVDPRVNFHDTVNSLLRAFTPLVPRAPSQAVPKAPATPAPSPALSLKEQLESRLYNDPDVEIRDTVQAIMASLFTPAAGTSSTAKDTKADTSDDKGKGKAKAVSFDIPAEDGASKGDVSGALDTLRNIEASFFALEADFVFPATLDLNADVPSTPPSPTDSDTSSLNSIERRLAYSARNAPVRYYQHALTTLLMQLDAIESHGSEAVRERRKSIVDRVENALEDVEKKVDVKLGKDAAPPAHSIEQGQGAEISTPEVETIPAVVEPAAAINDDAGATLANVVGERENVQASVTDEKVADSTSIIPDVVATDTTDLMVQSGSVVDSDDHGTIEPAQAIATVAPHPSPATSDATTITPDTSSVITPLPVSSDTISATESVSGDAFLMNTSPIETPSLSKLVHEIHKVSSISDSEDLVDIKDDDVASDGDTWLEIQDLI